jgi:thioredoxin-related protein
MKKNIAQTSGGTYSSLKAGIQWIEGLSWQEVKEKAKRENKYVFLDCFTTWCGPCKMMDRDVYVNDMVGNFVNDKFIAVRVQMDKSKNDNGYVQSWYQDAKEIDKRYLLEGYPTFLFFSPNGSLIHKEMGFMEAGKFITMAQTALTPGKVLNDDYMVYEQLLTAYKSGNINYGRLPFMINVAKKLGDTVSRNLIKLYEDNITVLSAKERFTRENIEFWTTLNLTNKGKFLRFFYQNGSQIDQVMHKKGYSRVQINKCIQNFIVAPFLEQQINNPDARNGVTTINTATGTVISSETCYDEADWKKLSKLIRKDFGRSYARSNLLQAKALWYKKNSNWIAYVRSSFEKFKTDPPDFDYLGECYMVNDVSWNIFLYIKDKDLINEGINWMAKVLQKGNESDMINVHVLANLIDTYANLLYKIGRNGEAIQWQIKSVSLEPNDKYRQKALGQMKIGEPTYGVKW